MISRLKLANPCLFAFNLLNRISAQQDTNLGKFGILAAYSQFELSLLNVPEKIDSTCDNLFSDMSSTLIFLDVG